MKARVLIRRLRREIRRSVEPLLEGRSSVALLDFPAHPNVGDSAIWLGELSLLADLGIGEPRYVCEAETFEPAALRRSRAGTILLHGGGNLGDLYPHHQELRERVIRSFPDRTIVQLPQSICFREQGNLERARRAIGEHPDIVLLLRDRRSLEFAREKFEAPSQLCPDTAFWLGRQSRRERPRRDRLWLMRTDGEAATRTTAIGQTETVMDWLEDDRSAVFRVHRWLQPWAARGGWGPLRRMAAGLLHWTYTRQATDRLERGLRLLGSSRRVVTDRLHAHILCIMLGIPHAVMEDRYGKIDAFYRTWTSECDLARRADSTEEALSFLHEAYSAA